MLLPSYKGSTFRGGILTAFKKSVCVMPDGKCDVCPLTANCSYYSLFEPHQLASGRGVPMPYLIEPPLIERRAFDVGDCLEFSVVLIGKATVYWKLLIFAVKRLGETSGIGGRVDGRRGRYQLKQVDLVALDKSRIPVYTADWDFQPVEDAPLSGEPVTLTSEQVGQLSNFSCELSMDGLPHEQATLQFLTPARLIENAKANSLSHKRLVTEFDFAFLMRELIRRLGDLSEAYCDGISLDWSPLQQSADAIQMEKQEIHWQDWERYSNRKRSRMKLGGLMGMLKLEGNLGPFLPYLRLGQWLHLGKQTTFGLGMYRLKVGHKEPFDRS